MALEDSSIPYEAPRGDAAPEDAAHRNALVREMVKGAILPHLLDRKDRGVFDRGPNVVRFPQGER